jgi:hypothetical protein
MDEHQSTTKSGRTITQLDSVCLGHVLGEIASMTESEQDDWDAG